MLGWVKPEEVKPEALVETEAKTEEKPVPHGVAAEEPAASQSRFDRASSKPIISPQDFNHLHSLDGL